MKLTPLLLALLGGALSTTPLAAQLVDYTVTDLGSGYNGLNTPGLNIIGINSAGEVTGTFQVAGGGLHAIRITGSGTVDLGTFAPPSGVPYLIAGASNASGQIVGGLHSGFQSLGSFLYDGTQVINLGNFGGSAINGGGQLAGAVTTGGQTHAAIYSGGSVQDLGVLGTGTFSSASAINDAGQVAGGSRTVGNGNTHAFRSNGGGLQDLGTLGGVQSFANGINASGQVTGWSEKAGFNAPANAFLYDGTTMIDLGNLGGSFAEGRSIVSVTPSTS